MLIEMRKGDVKFKVEIGQVFKNDNRNLVITDKEVRYNEKCGSRKYYKYTCNVCGWTEGWIRENHLLNGTGCSCCNKNFKKLVQGINDIPTVSPWMVKYFQGGYDEAKLYTKTGGGNPNNPKGYIYPICPDCGRVKKKKMLIYNIDIRHEGCSCSDKKPLGEKYMYGFLENLNVNFETEYSPEWIKPRRYDFCFKYKNEVYIVETHGEQHYKEGFSNMKNSRTFKEEHENDILKKELALKNGIKPENYIVIDCRKSELEWIRQNIISSKLNDVFDLSNIDWLEVEKFACSNLVKKVCDLWNNEFDILDICNEVKLKELTVKKYLNIGNNFNWCIYKQIKSESKNGKQVEIFKDDISLGIFPSCIELERQSEKLFGTKLHNNRISECCTGRKNIYKKYTFKYI
jgi:hypothetical protein